MNPKQDRAPGSFRGFLAGALTIVAVMMLSGITKPLMSSLLPSRSENHSAQHYQWQPQSIDNGRLELTLPGILKFSDASDRRNPFAGTHYSTYSFRHDHNSIKVTINMYEYLPSINANPLEAMFGAIAEMNKEEDVFISDVNISTFNTPSNAAAARSSSIIHIASIPVAMASENYAVDNKLYSIMILYDKEDTSAKKMSDRIFQSVKIN